MLLSRCVSWEVGNALENFKKLCTKTFTFSKSNIVFTLSIIKSFLPPGISYLIIYVQNLHRSISVTTARPPFKVRPNVILKSKFVNILASHWKKSEY